MISQKESLAAWQKFLSDAHIESIDVPYLATVGAATIAGVFHVRDPFEGSSTDGYVVGVVNGSFDINKNNQEASFNDPTGQLLKLIIGFSVPRKELWARLDNRNWDGSWNKGDTVIIWRG